MADLYLTPAEKYTAALGGFYYGDLPEPGTVYTQLIKDILDGSTPDKEPKNILARFIYSLYISDLGDPYPRYELAKLLYWKLHDITPTKVGSVLTVTIDGEEDYMTINTDLSRLWYKVLFGSKTDVITEFPYTFNTMQNKLSDWEVFGNTETSGTPTLDSPVMPQDTGERTGNLCPDTGWRSGQYRDGVWETTNTRSTSDFFPVSSNQYRLKINAGQLISFINFNYFDNQKQWLGNRATLGMSTFSPTAQNIVIPQLPSNAAYMSITIRFYNDNGNPPIPQSFIDDSNIMVSEGTSEPSYEPYGVKIPISSANTTTPVYLGEVETTRKIRKLVLTGEESGWQSASASEGRNRFTLPILNAMQADTAHFTSLSTHLPLGVAGATWNTDDVYTIVSSKIYMRLNAQYNTLSGFKSYLAAQYAAGTPVTVWYVLATEETGIVNEPLMKIGDYADSMSRTQTGIDIPTVIGQNTLDVPTTVKPSSMSIEYTSAEENQSRSKRISLLKSPLKKGLIK